MDRARRDRGSGPPTRATVNIPEIDATDESIFSEPVGSPVPFGAIGSRTGTGGDRPSGRNAPVGGERRTDGRPSFSPPRSTAPGPGFVRDPTPVRRTARSALFGPDRGGSRRPSPEQAASSRRSPAAPRSVPGSPLGPRAGNRPELRHTGRSFGGRPRSCPPAATSPRACTPSTARLLSPQRARVLRTDRRSSRTRRGGGPRRSRRAPGHAPFPAPGRPGRAGQQHRTGHRPRGPPDRGSAALPGQWSLRSRVLPGARVRAARDPDLQRDSGPFLGPVTHPHRGRGMEVLGRLRRQPALRPQLFLELCPPSLGERIGLFEPGSGVARRLGLSAESPTAP